MRLAFVVRSLFFQKPSFTTIHLAREAVRAGHEVAFLHLNGITWKNSGEVEADAVTPGDPNSLLGFLEPLRQESPPYRKIPSTGGTESFFGSILSTEISTKTSRSIPFFLWRAPWKSEASGF